MVAVCIQHFDAQFHQTILHESQKVHYQISSAIGGYVIPSPVNGVIIAPLGDRRWYVLVKQYVFRIPRCDAGHGVLLDGTLHPEKRWWNITLAEVGVKVEFLWSFMVW